MSSIYLRSACCEEDWSPLLDRLPNWERARKGYKNEGCVFFDNSTEGDKFHISSDTKEGSRKNLVDPDGLEVSLPHIPENCVSKSFLLNHTALTVSSLETSIPWWSEVLGVEPVLTNRGEFDPILQQKLNSSHFYHRNNFYITLREEEPAGKIHHIGWQVFEPTDMGVVKNILEEIQWPIVWEGNIDNSYVMHFKGPDGRVHDFFYTYL